MPAVAPESFPHYATLTRAHRVLLGFVALCAVFIALQSGADEPPPSRIHTVLAVGAALGTIVFRRLSTSPVIRPGTAAILVSISYAFGAGLAGVGAAVAAELGARQTGLVYTLVAGLLCLRPPARLAAPAPRS